MLTYQHDEEEKISVQAALTPQMDETPAPRLMPGHLSPIQRLFDWHGRYGNRAVQRMLTGSHARKSTLPPKLKSSIEALSNLPMDDVTVHYNSDKPAQVGALAFAQGTEIHLAPGQEQHLPHEGWHVVQQMQGRVRPTLQTKGLPVNDDPTLESEADQMGQRAANLSPVQSQDVDLEKPSHGISDPIVLGNGRYKIVARPSEQTAGSVIIHDRGDSTIELTDLGVRSDFRKQGLGMNLVVAAAHTGLKLGKSKVALTAQDNGSGRLLKWYEQMGFKQVGVHYSGNPRYELQINSIKSGAIQKMMPSLKSNSSSGKRERRLLADHFSLQQPVQLMDDEDDDEPFLANKKGWGLPQSVVDRLTTLINRYDVALNTDVARKQSDGDTSLDTVAVALSELIAYVSSLPRHWKAQLENIIHPGSYRRGGAKWEGKTFEQIINECARGEQCHNDLAEALRECLNTLRPGK